ncbi:unnamed protein product [Arabis nemorensis]|uniref:Defensin-like protein n=1 Tax=Arabis nemorensis TaxID=586526 RepID=A0A565BVC7_9BRAS|nr:unnamed protein product [Arabis nemorensis]
MEKFAALIFISILLFSTYTQILARSGYELCKEDSDCATLKCTTEPRCVKGGCECPREQIMDGRPEHDCPWDACFAKCKAKGEIIDACFSDPDRCYCRKPPM